MLCFVVVMQSFIMNSHEVFIHIHQGCFVGTGAIVRLPQCQWSKPGGYGKIGQCITTTKHSKAKTACIFLGIYCIFMVIHLLTHGQLISKLAYFVSHATFYIYSSAIVVWTSIWLSFVKTLTKSTHLICRRKKNQYFNYTYCDVNSNRFYCILAD